MTDAAMIMEITESLRECNPFYVDYLFDKTQAFLIRLIDDPDTMPRTPDDDTKSIQLFAAAQGYVTGYGAAVDHDYDEEATALNPNVDGRPAWMAFTSAMRNKDVDGVVMSRTSEFATTLMDVMGHLDDPVCYYGTIGFANGFSDGREQFATGEVEYLADESELFDEHTRMALEIMHDGLAFFEAKMKTSESETKSLQEQVTRLTNVLLGHSGFGRRDEDAFCACIETYVNWWLNGAIAQQSRLINNRMLRRYAREHGQHHGMFGNDVCDTRIHEFRLAGMIEERDEHRARGFVRWVLDGFIDQGMHPSELPPDDDDFWPIAAVACAGGRRMICERER